jgi:hypothetical protein
VSHILGIPTSAACVVGYNTTGGFAGLPPAGGDWAECAIAVSEFGVHNGPGARRGDVCGVCGDRTSQESRERTCRASRHGRSNQAGTCPPFFVVLYVLDMFRMVG